LHFLFRALSHEAIMEQSKVDVMCNAIKLVRALLQKEPNVFAFSDCSCGK